MGDPPEGRSALAARGRGGAPSPAPSRADLHTVLARTPDDFEPVEPDEGAVLDLVGLSGGVCDRA
jgi:hypothetical protein